MHRIIAVIEHAQINIYQHSMTDSVPREQVHEAGGARVGFDQDGDIVRATAGSPALGREILF